MLYTTAIRLKHYLLERYPGTNCLIRVATLNPVEVAGYRDRGAICYSTSCIRVFNQVTCEALEYCDVTKYVIKSIRSFMLDSIQSN